MNDPVTPQDPSPGRGVSHYNPIEVDIKEAVGTLFLGVMTVLLFIALLRSQRENRALLRQLSEKAAE